MQVVPPSLATLRRQYASLTLPSTLLFPSNLDARLTLGFFLNDILLDPHLNAYPPSIEYQKAFWKWAISHLECEYKEGDDVEVDSQIYDHYLRLLNLLPDQRVVTSKFLHRQPPSLSFITYYWAPIKVPGSILEPYYTATCRESRNVIEAGTTGLRTWTASFVLAQYLIKKPGIITTKRVLELGSGVGLLGIVVASLQLFYSDRVSPQTSCSVWLTDVNETVLQTCRDNLSLPCNLSSSHPNVRYSNLDWSASMDDARSKSLATLLHQEINPHIILGADIVFDPSLISPLIGTLKLALEDFDGSAERAEPKVAIIALTLRNEATTSRFLTHAVECNLSVEEVMSCVDSSNGVPPFVNNQDSDTVKIFHITLSRSVL